MYLPRVDSASRNGSWMVMTWEDYSDLSHRSLSSSGMSGTTRTGSGGAHTGSKIGLSQMMGECESAR